MTADRKFQLWFSNAPFVGCCRPGVLTASLSGCPVGRGNACRHGVRADCWWAALCPLHFSFLWIWLAWTGQHALTFMCAEKMAVCKISIRLQSENLLRRRMLLFHQVWKLTVCPWACGLVCIVTVPCPLTACLAKESDKLCVFSVLPC